MIIETINADDNDRLLGLVVFGGPWMHKMRLSDAESHSCISARTVGHIENTKTRHENMRLYTNMLGRS